MVVPVEAAADVDEAFMALVCDDDELLRAEFDAIIGAGWPPVRPPDHPDRPSGGPPRRARREAGRRSATHRAVRREVGPVARGRERSPPAGRRPS
ncbi:hypothetical protein LJR027_000922 [Terrabacter sp. LjRoot27]|uniref:hypothetical protein n=1 Tax=Terrabacter sp. LjRoot27 TaxID=3342306 RepID=UPI003ECC7F22